MILFLRIIFWTSISWIVLCLFVLTIGQYMPFQFSNESSAETFYALVWLIFPVAVLLTLLKKVISPENRTSKALIIFLAIVSFLFLSVYVFGRTMCGYITDDILFVNKSDTSLKVIKRHYDCGAYDSDLPKYEFYKMKSLTKQILYSKKVDTTKLDKNKWIRKETE
ncbi:MAG: hypothetical protein E6H07_14360 [Bacteroidetes bacterium]|nr:MAG: hypothetical protein E6H07_14360 [Bacteroidota bacterium]